MINSCSVSLNDSQSMTRPPALRSRSAKAIFLLSAMTPLTIPLLWGGGCAAQDPASPDISPAEVDEMGGGNPPNGPQWPPPKPLCQAQECSGVECPADFSRVGAAGMRGSFCMTQEQQAAVTFLQAMTDCFTMTTSTGAVPHLCSVQEWYIACSQGADTGQPGIDDMTNGPEWSSNVLTPTTTLVIGNGSCSKTASGSMTKPFAFRCCVS